MPLPGMENNADSSILQLTARNFKDEVLDSSTPVLIDFWAPWCGPCRMMKPILHDAANLLAGKVRVAQVNIDDERDLAEAFRIRSIPTCVLIKGNQVLDSFVGVVPAQKLAADSLKKVA